MALLREPRRKEYTGREATTRWEVRVRQKERERERQKGLSSCFEFSPSRNCKDDPGGRRTNVYADVQFFMCISLSTLPPPHPLLSTAPAFPLLFLFFSRFLSFRSTDSHHAPYIDYARKCVRRIRPPLAPFARLAFAFVILSNHAFAASDRCRGNSLRKRDFATRFTR